MVGLVETHGRVETERQIGDLEVIPRTSVRYGGVEVTEMDVDAVLKRHPDVVLVDELAHTNAPGSLRPKRYLDVEVILQHGIDVISTVNVQHLESMNGLVAGITGIGVREIIPDRVLDDADEVHLVDLPVSALIDRLEIRQDLPAGTGRPGADRILPGRQPDRAARTRPAAHRGGCRRPPLRPDADPWRYPRQCIGPGAGDCRR